jgi:phosphinothricin acetyltransferase
VGISIEAMTAADWDAVRAIFREGIDTGHATFETGIPSWKGWDRAHLRECRLVARRDGRVVGWAALSRVSGRGVYRGVAEVSIYVAAAARRGGVGRALLGRLVRDSEAAGFWTLQAGLFSENAASIALHRACGFREVGLRQRLGQLSGEWRDILLMERRSPAVE